MFHLSAAVCTCLEWLAWPSFPTAGTSLDLTSNSLNCLIGYVSENLDLLLNTARSKGFPLPFLHIFPFFQNLETFFDAIHSFLDLLAAYILKPSVDVLNFAETMY